MIISLAQDRIRAAAKAAAREQAWTDGRGVRGVPMRRLGGSPLGENWDLTAVYEAIDRADSLEWRGGDLTVRVAGDHVRVFTIARGDDSDLVDVVGSSDLDWLHQLAGQAETSTAALQAGNGSSSGWVVACPPPSCGLTGDPRQSRPEAEHLAGVHDGLHHGGSPTARVTPAVPAPPAAAPRSRPVVAVGWEVDDPDGAPIYRGADLELASELYHLGAPGSHLLPVAMAGVRS